MPRLRPVVYVRFSPEQLKLRLVGTSVSLVDSPEVAYDPRDQRVVLIGRSEHVQPGPALEVGNGFAHPRTVIGAVELAEIALRYALERLLASAGRRWRTHLRPDLVLHPLAVPEDGLSSFEYRGLVDFGKRCKCRRVRVWVGHELTDAEILAGNRQPKRRLLRRAREARDGER
ncbi:MAG TPA: hypothetical protein VF746_04395 [Longimicrobium sp.]